MKNLIKAIFILTKEFYKKYRKQFEKIFFTLYLLSFAAVGVFTGTIIIKLRGITIIWREIVLCTSFGLIAAVLGLVLFYTAGKILQFFKKILMIIVLFFKNIKDKIVSIARVIWEKKKELDAKERSKIF